MNLKLQKLKTKNKMQLNYKQALKNNNITEADLLKSTKQKHDDLLAMVNGLETLKSKAENADGAELEKINKNIEKIEVGIEALDAELVKKINNHHKMVEQTKKMQAGRGLNKNNTSNVQPQNQVVEETQQKVEPQVVEQTPSAEVVNNDNTTTSVEVTEEKANEKKGSGWGGILFGVVLLAVTAGAVNYFRNKD